jgi:ankyrin repeat protein
MEHNKILFDLLRKDEFDKFKEFINKKETVDVNIRDDSGNYLITYAIIKNNISSVKLLLDKNCRIDIKDQEGKTLLYLPIKYNYNEIIKLLIEYNEKNIGISIVDLSDVDGNIPLHYSIYFRNLDALDILLKANSNVNFLDRNGSNALHLAVYSKDSNICEKIIKNNININAINLIGETALHIACNLKLDSIAELLINNNIDINIKDSKTEMTPLVYAINRNSKTISLMLLHRNANVDIQDFMGNTVVHYAILEETFEILLELIKYNPNVNLYNIDGNIPLHLLLNKDKIYENEITEFFIDQSNLNFQNNDGDTSLHFVCKKELWNIYKDILIKKKLNIFITNHKNVMPIDYIKKNQLHEFFELVIKSYLYILHNYNFIWREDWQNICNKELFYNKLNPNELKIINKYIKNIDKNKDVCSQIISNKLNELYKNKNPNCETNSYPQKKFTKCVHLDTESSNLELCTFTGETIEILLGLIFLLRKYNNACSTLTSNFKINNDLCNYFLSIGIKTHSKCEFLNFEIVWVYKKLFFSDNFHQNFKKCLNNKNIRFIIIPLGIEIEKGSHANYLIFDKKTYELERFEPYGSGTPYKFNYNNKLLDNLLSFKFSEIDNNIKYINPDKYLPKIGFQYFDIYESKTSKIGDPAGFCALWSIWYTDMRMKYPDVNRKSLVNKLLKEIKMKGISFKNLIRNYSHDIIELRDKVFNVASITINDWNTDQYTEDQFKIVISEISKLLDNISRH